MTQRLPGWVWVVGAAVPVSLLLFATPKKAGEGRSGYSYGGPDSPAGYSRDPGLLIPAFARRVELLFQRLRAQGYSPVLIQGYRTAAQAEDNAQRGTGIVKSQHILGAAVDIHDANAAPGFPAALGRTAKELGLTWGGDFSSRSDWAHVQAAPGKLDGKMWAMDATTREAFVRQLLG